MSADRSTKVDLDLLADYVGGALDGTAQEAAVARLVAEDPEWAREHERMARATRDVRRALSEWGAAPAPMPPDVVERMSAAITAAGTHSGVRKSGRDDHGTTGAQGIEPRRRAGRPVRGPEGRPGGRPEGGPARPGRRTSRRMPRWATPLAVAAALAAVAGLGISQFVSDHRGTENIATQAEDSGGSAAQPAPQAEPTADRLLATGTGYTRARLVDQVRALGARAASGKAPSDTSAVPLGSGEVPRPASGAATEPATLAACLTAIAAEHGRGPVRTELVDYATFEGQPALVVVFTDRDGQRWAWAVSRACGQPQSGAAARYTARVG